MPLLRYGVKAVGGWSIWCSGGGLGVGCGIGVARTLRLPGLRQRGLRHAQAATMMGRYLPPLNPSSLRAFGRPTRPQRRSHLMRRIASSQASFQTMRKRPWSSIRWPRRPGPSRRSTAGIPLLLDLFDHLLGQAVLHPAQHQPLNRGEEQISSKGLLCYGGDYGNTARPRACLSRSAGRIEPPP